MKNEHQIALIGAGAAALWLLTRKGKGGTGVNTNGQVVQQQGAAVFGAVVSRKDLSANISAAVSDVVSLKKYSDIKPKSAMILYGHFAGDINSGVYLDSLSSINQAIYKKLDYDLLEWDYDHAVYRLSGRGKDLVRAIGGRFQTLTNKKRGADMFPDIGRFN